MIKFTSTARPGFPSSQLTEAVAEVGLAAGAAVFTAAVWLSVGAWAIAPQQSANTTVAARQNALPRVTLPPVHIVGRRDTLLGMAATTTAQNTAANTVTLNQ